MRKTVVLMAMTAVMFLVAILATAEEMCVPMGEITLEPLTAEPQRSPVAFPHATHFNYSCQQCHHTWNGKESITGCSASGCHDLAEAPEAKEASSVKIRYFKNAFHQSCIGCHKDIKTRNKALENSRMPLDEKLPATGPTGCNQCHPKE